MQQGAITTKKVLPAVVGALFVIVARRREAYFINTLRTEPSLILTMLMPC